jgi:hypothetical protein
MAKFLKYPFEEQLDLEKINDIDISILPYNGFDASEHPSYPGKEHYKLLAFLSNQINSRDILDIGTHRGFSAIALSHNFTNTVHSFDIVENIDQRMKMIPNINFYIEDLWNPETREKRKEMILNSGMIFLDIDPHDGIREYEFYCFLRDNNYSGVLIVDDIWYFKGMRDNFWYLIPSENKLDITKYGHWSGSGLIKFNNINSNYNNNWTFVTAYFDLTKCPDASQEIKNRDFEYYLNAANTTMCIDANLVVYCEPEFLEKFKNLRPDHLKHKTHYITCEFDDFPLNKYRNKIIENRKKIPSADPRNTASYYLFCMSRYEMIKRSIDENIFGSTHFAWINICIERYGYRNVMALEEVMAENRNKFSTCYIDFIPQSVVNNLPFYFERGRCSLCSGFFTGNTYYFRLFCELIEKQFLEYLEAGYGHADEQLYSPIYFKHPEIFKVYFGDYLSMVTNYAKVKTDTHSIIYFLMNNSFNHQYYHITYMAGKAIWKFIHENSPYKDRSYDATISDLLGESKNHFLNMFKISARAIGDYSFENII